MDETLLSIGDLAAASGLSPKALRMYAESGLLPPRHIDPFTGYRSYGRDQVERARLIAALRGLGMGLARIQVLCDLDAAAAVSELRSWWRQEEADVFSRRAAVGSLARDLGGFLQEDSTMTASTASTNHPSQVATAAHRGIVRPTQQDAVLHRDLPDGAVLLAVADGFGADDALSSRILEAFTNAVGPDPSADPLAALETAWAAAEALIPARGPTAPLSPRPCSTPVACTSRTSGTPGSCSCAASGSTWSRRTTRVCERSPQQAGSPPRRSPRIPTGRC